MSAASRTRSRVLGETGAASSRERARDLARRPSRGPSRATGAGVAIALPDPPLVDAAAGIALRPWTAATGDVAALVRAWSDPAVAAFTAVPEDGSAAAAARWLRGDPGRRAAGRCLDLVVGPLDGGSAVLGEVGLRHVDRVRRRAEIGWWIAAEHRGHGLASVATRLVAGWALAHAGGLDHVWARVDAANVASARVAAAAGFRALGRADGCVVWARSRPAG